MTTLLFGDWFTLMIAKDGSKIKFFGVESGKLTILAQNSDTIVLKEAGRKTKNGYCRAYTQVFHICGAPHQMENYICYKVSPIIYWVSSKRKA